MNHKHFLAGAAVAGLAIVVAGCTTTPASTERVTRMAAAKDSAGEALSITELGATTPVSESAVAALAADNFWGHRSSAAVDADGQLVFKSAGGIIDDPSYNRNRLERVQESPTGTRLGRRPASLPNPGFRNPALVPVDARRGAQMSIGGPVQRDTTVRRAPSAPAAPLPPLTDKR